MTEKTRIFISYKTGVNNGLTKRATVLRDTVAEDQNNTIWMDGTNLVPGKDWNEQIYDAMRSQDIVLLVLGENTEKSDWVRREIDLAKGAKAAILPVKVMANVKSAEVLDYFGIGTRQYIDFSAYDPTQKTALLEGIQQLAGRTRGVQWEWLKQRAERKQGQASLPTTIFISHNENEDKDIRFEINSLSSILEKAGYAVIGIKEDVVPGMDSNLEQISESDVVLALLTESSINSVKVKREIDYAKGAQIEVVPVVMREIVDLKGALTKNLDLPATFTCMYLTNTVGEKDELLRQLKTAEQSTNSKHKKWYNELAPSQPAKDKPSKENSKKAYNPPTAELNTYQLAGSPTTIHLAAGNMFAFENTQIDVIVNSENNFMQMARFFEFKTVSHQLRKLGAKYNNDGLLEEDTVQNELTAMTFALFKPLPVPNGEVIVTSAGHPNSQLRKKNVRYIFHAATILVTDTATGIKPIDVTGTKKSVKTALEKFWEINQKNGVVAPPNTTERRIQEEMQQSFKPITSIIFPLFGTGHGQRSVDEAIPPMAEAFFEYLTTVPSQNPGPKKIYLSVYSEEDIERADEALSRFFKKVDT